ncbi:ArsC/Spx/MgsR family protein [Maritimibacter sp. HL-12]|uniref:ArsC/Spx/MgsR family protein n=1 Tax=Maritimibacter sp. HL-12 TaxID=1162418 RepID=UPI000A0F08D7|nr:ArsC/Spx/MgsR family protein [Maritimibacter sp. HL-12]SMH35166.1 Arsenate reductase, glutaredoxin family [Maritimibacter sp. HL-12]
MKVYGIANCDTVKKALRALAAAGFSPELVDIRKSPLEDAEIDRFFNAFGEALVNRRSTTWRGLSQAAREQAPERLISAHPALMKRPVIEAEGDLTLGWDKTVQERWLGSAA